MKKTLVLALGVFLLMAFCAPVMPEVKAETKLDFSGHYRVRYWYRNNSSLSNDADQEDKQSYFDQRFRIQPTFTVSDCLKLVTRWRAINGVQYGQNPSGMNNSDLWLERAYMDIKTKYGLFAIGRQSGGTAGLTSLGYDGPLGMTTSDLLYVDPFDSEGPRDRIKYTLPLGAATLVGVYEKTTEQDSGNLGGAPANTYPQGWFGYDDDRDLYALAGLYKWATGNAGLWFIYTRDHTVTESTETQNNVNFLPYVYRDTNIYTINGALINSFGPFSLHFEGIYQFGTSNVPGAYAWNGANWVYANVDRDVDLEGWGVYLDMNYNFGPGDAGLMFSYVDGADVEVDNAGNITKVSGMTGMGGDHAPFLVFYDVGVVNNHQMTNYFANAGANLMQNPLGNPISNHWMLGLYGDYSLTERLMLYASIGYFSLTDFDRDQATILGFAPNEEPSKDLGAEMDVLLTWKIMDGLMYSSGFGYFWGGDAYNYGVSANETGNAYAWKNMLKLSF